MAILFKEQISTKCESIKKHIQETEVRLAEETISDFKNRVRQCVDILNGYRSDITDMVDTYYFIQEECAAKEISPLIPYYERWDEFKPNDENRLWFSENEFRAEYHTRCSRYQSRSEWDHTCEFQLCFKPDDITCKMSFTDDNDEEVYFNFSLYECPDNFNCNCRVNGKDEKVTKFEVSVPVFGYADTTIYVDSNFHIHLERVTQSIQEFITEFNQRLKDVCQ